MGSNGWGLLASATGLSTALLSKLEPDRMIPTLPTLATISRVYGVGMSHFFQDAERHTLSITRKACLQGSGRAIETQKCVPLNSPGTAPRLLAFLVELEPGHTSVPEEHVQETCGFVHVLEGRLELNTGNLREELEPGDCVYVESLMPVSWSAVGDASCRLLVVRPGPAPSHAN